MKKTLALRIISLALVIIMLPFVFCACNKAEDAKGNYESESAGSTIMSPEKDSNSTVHTEGCWKNATTVFSFLIPAVCQGRAVAHRPLRYWKQIKAS